MAEPYSSIIETHTGVVMFMGDRAYKWKRPVEFAFLDQVLAARKAAGLTQADIAQRIGTTQSAIARLESGSGKHLPSLATLHKYANAVGCRVEIRLVKGTAPAKRAGVRTAAAGR